MISETVNSVIAAENEVNLSVEEARKKSARIISDAELKAVEISTDATRRGEEALAAKIEETRVKISISSNDIFKRSEKDAARLNAKIAENSEIAAKSVISALLGR